MAEISQVRLGGWTGGLNLDTDPFQASPDEVVEGSVNFDIGPRGAVAKRRGYSQYVSDSARIERYARWKKTGGALYHVLVRNDGQIRYGTTSLSNGPNLPAAGSSQGEYLPTMAVLNEKLYVSSLRDHEVQRFDGSSWKGLDKSDWISLESDLDDAINNGEDLPSDRAPRCRKLLSAYSRLFAFNVILPDGTREPSRVYYSGYEADPAFDPEIWPATNWERIGGDDGQEITGAIQVGHNAIIVFKTHSTYIFGGRTRDEFIIQQLSNRIGTIAPETAVEVKGSLVFFDPYSGVWTWDGAVFGQLDEKIRKSLLAGINQDYSWRSTAIFHEDKYYLSVPWGSSDVPNRTFVKDMNTGAWTVYDYGFKSAFVWENKLLATDVREGNGVFRLNHTDADDGAGIDFQVVFPWLIPEELGAAARIRRADFALSPTGAFDIDCALYSEWSTTPEVTKTLPGTSDGGVWDESDWDEALWDAGSEQVQTPLAGWGGYRRSYQFQLSNSEANEPVQINQLALQVSGRRRNRGTR